MSRSQRDKGLLGEREVRHAFERAGFAVRGLDGAGDNLVVCPSGRLLHLETKRQEVLRIPDWTRQAAREAPAAAIPVVVYRRSREPWHVVLRLDEFLKILN